MLQQDRSGRKHEAKRPSRGLKTEPAAAAESSPPRGVPAAPPMAELRRRATERLRRLERLLAIVQAEHQAAAAECERLRAAKPDAVGALDIDRNGGTPATDRPAVRRVKPASVASPRRSEQKEALISDLGSATERGRVTQADGTGQPGRDRSARTSPVGVPREAEAGSLLSFLDDLAEALSPASDRPPRP